MGQPLTLCKASLWGGTSGRLHGKKRTEHSTFRVSDAKAQMMRGFSRFQLELDYFIVSY